jgi:hypothetical protein
VSGMAPAPAVSRRALMTLLACVAAMLAFTLTTAAAARADLADDGDIAITDDGANRLDLWTIGSDRAIWQKTWQAGQGWTDWISRGGTAKSPPSVLHFPDGHYTIYIRGSDDGLWTKSYSAAGGWTGWTAAGGSYASNPQATYTDGGRWVNVVGRDANGDVNNRVWTSTGGWATSETTAGPVIGSPTVIDWTPSGGPSRGDVFALRSGTDVYRKTSQNLRWTDWRPLNGLATSSVHGDYGGGQLTLVARGSDSGAWFRQSRDGESWPLDWAPLSGMTLSSAPTVHYWPQSNGTPRWIVVGRDTGNGMTGRVVADTYTNDSWNGWTAIAPISNATNYVTSIAYGGSDAHITTQDEAENTAWAIEDADGPTADYLRAGIDPADRALVDATLKLTPFYDVAVTTDGPDRLDLWTLRKDRAIYQKTWQSGVGWSGWVRLDGSSKSPPSVIHFPDGTYTIYARGSDNGLWTRTFTPSAGWGAWTDKHLQIESSPQTSYAANTNTVNVVARNARGGVINRVLTAGGDFVMDLPSDAAAVGSPTVIDWVNGSAGWRGDIFTVGPNFAVYQRTNINLQWTTPDWVSVQGNATSNVHADFGDGQLTLATRDPDGRTPDIRTWRAESGWSPDWAGLGGSMATSPTVRYWPDADGNARWIVIGRDGFNGGSPRPGEIIADVYTKSNDHWSGWLGLTDTPGGAYPGTSIQYGGGDFTINTQAEIDAAVTDIRAAGPMFADNAIAGIRAGSERDTVWQTAFPVSWACGDATTHSATTSGQVACVLNLFDTGTLDADAQNVLDGLTKDNLTRLNAVLRARVGDNQLVRDVSDGRVYLYSVFGGGAVRRVSSAADAAAGGYNWDAARRVSHTVLSSWAMGPPWTPPAGSSGSGDPVTPAGYSYAIDDPTTDGDPDVGSPAYDDGQTSAYCTPDAETDEDCAVPDAPDEGGGGGSTRSYSTSLGLGQGGWGLSVQRPEALTNADSKHLHVTRARIIVPWDVVSRVYRSDRCGAQGDVGRNYANLRAWADAARANGQQMLVSFGRCADGSEYGHLPTTAEYRAAITSFLRSSVFSDIHDFTAWNEPNSSGQPTSYSRQPAGSEIGPHAAGKFWSAFNKLCEANHCTVAAGDFVDGTDFSPRYMSSYKSALDKQPSVWAFHPYFAGNSLTSNPTAPWEGFLRATQRTDGHSSPRIWITEAGGVVNSLTWQNRTEDQARAATQKLLGSAIAGRSTRISRFYYYAVVGDAPKVLSDGRNHAFDSGLLRYGTLDQRPMYADYLAKTNPTNRP